LLLSAGVVPKLALPRLAGTGFVSKFWTFLCLDQKQGWSGDEQQ
jgi:hypothetical protein